MGNLTVIKVKSIKDAGRYSDGSGLLLVVKESGAKSWLLRAQANGKRRDIGLGTYPAVSLADARDAAAEARKQIRAGEDPVAAKRAAKKAAAVIPTFRVAAKTVHDEQKGDWINSKHQSQWINTLTTFAYPIIGDRPINRVTSADVLDVLKPIWQTKPETARRVLQRIGKVLDWGYSRGHCLGEAPMRSIRAGLPRQTKRPEHFESLPHKDVASLMAMLKASDTAGRLALRFLILTAARSGEVRGATWDEIGDGIWTVPAERMKAKKEHVVPLTAAAVAVLDTAKKLRKGVVGEPIFPGPSSHKPLSDMTLTKVLRTETKDKSTVHGFRSSFRDWAAECTSFPSEIAETALAHAIPDKVVAAYRRTNYLEKRRDMMNQWADYVAPSQSTV
ncbi:integrase arm-type DNA-binding domain-containing protein [Sphingomonas sp. 4RDLI-65]|uniref:tyrosine-type recombinase/integrase n=1 Tax=Sphingomonas sp. 4RDLI-65 TaxID=3111641 RepID=UPI003C241B9D